MDILGVISSGYGLIAGDADFVEFRIPQDGTYSYTTVNGSSALNVRWKTNMTLFHELLDSAPGEEETAAAS